MPTDGAGRRARVVSVGRNAVWLAFEDEERLRIASLRKHEERLALVPGDLVRALPLDDERVVVTLREPRSFALERTTAGGRTKTMAANIDGIAIVAALARPAPHLEMIDELLAFGEIHALRARIVFTKLDLGREAGVDAGGLLALYRGLGYPAYALDPRTAAGANAVREAFAGSATLLIGQSGVGKSSLFRALGGNAEVGDVSKIGRGRQTTTTGRLHRFEEGFLIDSPGVGEFELSASTDEEIALGFVEFAAVAADCRFDDCRHRTEPGCAVRAAVDSSRIAASRYASYRAILAREDARRANAPYA